LPKGGGLLTAIGERETKKPVAKKEKKKFSLMKRNELQKKRGNLTLGNKKGYLLARKNWGGALLPSRREKK